MSYVISVSDEERAIEVAFYVEDILLDNGTSVQELLGREVLKAINKFKEVNKYPYDYGIPEVFRDDR